MPSNDTTWKPGKSGNPKGRPKLGETYAEIVRSKLPPEEADKRACERYDAAVAKGDLALAQRIDEWRVDRGWGKAPQAVDVTIDAGGSEDVDWNDVPLEKRRELAAALAAADAIAGSDEGG